MMRITKHSFASTEMIISRTTDKLIQSQFIDKEKKKQVREYFERQGKQLGERKIMFIEIHTASNIQPA